MVIARVISATIVIGSVLLISCSSSPGGGVDGEWVGERYEEDEITTVINISGSVWGGKARLVEEISIGSLGGDDADLFGQIRSITCDGKRIFVLDDTVPVVRVYDLNGQHLTDVGRGGDGPGEFRRPRSMAINPADGTLFVRDGQNSRINIYSPEGNPLGQWRLFSGWQMDRQMFFADNGVLYTPAIMEVGVPVEEWRFGVISWGPEGASGDTLAEPLYDFKEWKLIARQEGGGTSTSNVPFSPEVVWNASQSRIIVSGISDEYRFEVRFPDGRLNIIERDYDPVPVHPDEAAWLEKAETTNMRSSQPGWAWNGPAIPRHKAAYIDLYPDLSNRVWVQRPGPGVIMPDGVEDPVAGSRWWLAPYWVDSSIVDVFELEGKLLGEVEVPEGFLFDPPPFIKDDMVIAAMQAGDGTPYLKRYRLVLPDSQ